jgi:drug/metabolite transporter (DMT)-like permease
MRRGSLVRLALLALLWGSGFLWIKLALRGFTPVQIVFVRLGLGAVVLALIALLSGLRPPTARRTWAHLTVAALVATTIPYTLVGIGEQTIGSNVAGVLHATTPVWTVLVAFLVGPDRVISVRRGIGIALGFAGTLFILSPWESASEMASWGGTAVLGAAASYAVSFVYMARYLANRGIPPLMLSACQLAIGTVLIAVALPVGGGLAPLAWRGDAVVSLLVLSVFGTAIAYVLNYRLIADEGPTVTSTTTYLLPVVAVLLGVLFLDEPTTVAMIVGGLLVLAGVALAQRDRTGGGTYPPIPVPAPAPARQHDTA